MATHHHLGYNFAAGAQASITTSAFSANAAVVVRTIYLYALDAGFTGTGYPDVDGDGLTYVGRRSFGTDRRFWILTAVGSPSAGALTIEFSTAMGDTLENPLYFVVESRPESGGDLSFVQLAGIEEAAPSLNLGNDYDAVLALSVVTAGNALLGFFWKLNVGTDPWTVSRAGWSSIQEQRHYGGAVSDRTIVVGRADDDTTAEVEALAASNNSPWAGWVLELAESAGGGVEQPIGQASESDTALAATHARSASAGLASEGDTALGISWTRSAPLGQAQEADAAQALSHARSAALGTPTEVSTALGVGWARAAALGLAQETSAALAVTHARARGIDQVATAETAFAITAALLRIVPVGQAQETSVALPFAGIQKRFQLGLPVETDAALGITPSLVLMQPVGQAAEADTALNVAHSRARAVGQAPEVDTATAVAYARVRALGLAPETAAALALGWSRAAALGLSTESDVALAVAALTETGLAIGQAIESDTALGATWARLRTAGLALEADSALGLGYSRAAALGLAPETDLAFPLGSSTLAVLGRADELDTALAAAWARARAIGVASEADVAQAVQAWKALAIGMPTEEDTALGILTTLGAVLGRADELDTATTLAWARALGLGAGLETDTAFAFIASGGFEIAWVQDLEAQPRYWDAAATEGGMYTWHRGLKQQVRMRFGGWLPAGVSLATVTPKLHKGVRFEDRTDVTDSVALAAIIADDPVADREDCAVIFVLEADEPPPEYGSDYWLVAEAVLSNGAVVDLEEAGIRRLRIVP